MSEVNFIYDSGMYVKDDTDTEFLVVAYTSDYDGEKMLCASTKDGKMTWREVEELRMVFAEDEIDKDKNKDKKKSTKNKKDNPPQKEQEKPKDDNDKKE